MDVRRLGRLLFTVSLAFASLGLPARADDDATALLAKHKAYVGWELGDGSIKTLDKKGAIARRGKDGARVDTYSTHEADVGILYRLDETSVKTGSGFSQGFNGNKFWYASSNGFVVPNVGESRGDILAQRVVFAEATTKLQGTVVRHDTIDGTPVTVVRELLPSKVPLDLFVDPQTGAYKKYVYDPEGASPTKVDIDAYADALGGKKVVSTWHYEDSPNTHYYDTIAANQTFPDSALSPPPPTAKWIFATGKTIPLEVTPQAIYVLATFNGVQGRFVLDTGAGAIALTDAFADRANVQRVQAMEFSGLTGSKRGSYAKVKTISFADGSELDNVRVTTGISMPDRIDGLLGFDFLAGAIADFDLDKGQLTLYDPTASAPNEGQGVVVAPDLATNQPVIPVKLEGKVPSQALLDSGAETSVLLSHTLVSKLKVIIKDQRFGDETPELATTQYAVGVSGNIEALKCGQIESVNIGPINYSNTGVCFTNGLEPGGSLLGIHFIEKFNLTFDYPDGKIIMQPRKDI